MNVKLLNCEGPFLFHFPSSSNANWKNKFTYIRMENKERKWLKGYHWGIYKCMLCVVQFPFIQSLNIDIPLPRSLTQLLSTFLCYNMVWYGWATDERERKTHSNIFSTIRRWLALWDPTSASYQKHYVVCALSYHLPSLYMKEEGWRRLVGGGAIKKEEEKKYKIKLVKKSALLIIIRFRVTNVCERVFKCMGVSNKYVCIFRKIGGKLFTLWWIIIRFHHT